VAEAVTKALAQRLERERAVREETARIMAAASRLREHYDLRPVTKQEWDEGWGEET
jgi:hypothetical protein